MLRTIAPIYIYFNKLQLLTGAAEIVQATTDWCRRNSATHH